MHLKSSNEEGYSSLIISASVLLSGQRWFSPWNRSNYWKPFVESAINLCVCVPASLSSPGAVKPSLWQNALKCCANAVDLGSNGKKIPGFQ